MALAGIQLVSVPVADQDRALAFYRDTLGFEVNNSALYAIDETAGESSRQNDPHRSGGKSCRR